MSPTTATRHIITEVDENGRSIEMLCPEGSAPSAVSAAVNLADPDSAHDIAAGSLETPGQTTSDTVAEYRGFYRPGCGDSVWSVPAVRESDLRAAALSSPCLLAKSRTLSTTRGLLSTPHYWPPPKRRSGERGAPPCASPPVSPKHPRARRLGRGEPGWPGGPRQRCVHRVRGPRREQIRKRTTLSPVGFRDNE